MMFTSQVRVFHVRPTFSILCIIDILEILRNSYCIVLRCIVLYCSVFYSIPSYLFYCNALYCIVWYGVVLCCIELSGPAVVVECSVV